MTNAAYEAFGLAVGNLLLARFLLILLYLGLLYLFRNLVRSIEFPETYSFVERAKVLNFLAFQLLLIRDGKHKKEHLDFQPEEGCIGMEEKTVLNQLHAELANIPKTDRFFTMENSDTSERNESVQENPLQKQSKDYALRLTRSLKERKQWAKEKMYVEVLDNPLEPTKSLMQSRY